jgi:uncharacterized protein GlcG (DUF336 family)
MLGELSTKRAWISPYFILAIFIATLTACSENQTPTPQLCDGLGTHLTALEVTDIVTKAASSLSAANTMTVAVVDRKGTILAVYRNPGATGSDDDLAVSLARTGAFFSNNQAPLSSRTVRFISGIHFPPGISFTGNAALYGIEHTNRGCELNLTFKTGQAVPPAKSVNGLACNATDQSGCGRGITTGKVNFADQNAEAVNPGGIPIFRGCTVIGGVGIAGVSADLAESAALAAISSFPPSVPPPGVVVVEGIRLPFVKQSPAPAGTASLGPFFMGPIAGGSAPDGDLIAPIAGTQLTLSEVNQIVQQSIAVAGRTRAVIRLPMGLTTRMAIAVSDLNGNILALHRMPDSTIFSIDVAVAKARNVVYFSGSDPNRSIDLPGVPVGTAVTNRTLSFGSQPLYPPGIDGTAEGPFAKLFKDDEAKACSLGHQSANLNQNGIVFFPGSLPLYKNGVLIGGLGVSGDGVEQDDYVSWNGGEGFQPEEAIRADQVFIQGARLPFIKFPRNPEAR